MRPTELPKTLQEIFNVVWERSKTKERAYVPGYGCTYRSNIHDPTSLACFIGECIPDVVYTEIADDIEHRPADVVSNRLGNIWEEFKQDLVDLQNIHDRVGPDCWEDCLRLFAADRGLTIQGE